MCGHYFLLISLIVFINNIFTIQLLCYRGVKNHHCAVHNEEFLLFFDNYMFLGLIKACRGQKKTSNASSSIKIKKYNLFKFICILYLLIN